MNSVPLRIISTLLIVLVVGPAACRTASSKYRRASDDMAAQLARQVERRLDLRQVRLLIYGFQPCASAAEARYSPHWGSHTEHELAGQIKHQLITALARRMIVVEGDAVVRSEKKSGERRPAGSNAEDRGLSPYPEAELLGANAVLVGNYVIEGGDDIVVMARMVDATSNEILATAEETIRRVDLPAQMPPTDPGLARVR